MYTIVTLLLEGMSFTQLKLLVPQDPGLIIVGPLNILLLTWNHGIIVSLTNLVS